LSLHDIEESLLKRRIVVIYETFSCRERLV